MLGRRKVLCGAGCCCVAASGARGAADGTVVDPRGRFTLGYTGSFAATMQRGEIGARIRASDLPARQSWAVGPTAGLAGELTIADGRAFIATIAHRRVRVAEDRSAGAPFLVWAEVARWKAEPLPPDLGDQRALERHLGARAEAVGLDPEGPFPFLVTGAPRRVEWHVLDGPGRRPAHGQPHGAGHGANRLTTQDRPMMLVGFYSRRHEDVFTHRGEFSHIHMLTDDHTLSGHVDAVTPGPGLMLHLPD